MVNLDLKKINFRVSVTCVLMSVQLQLKDCWILQTLPRSHTLARQIRELRKTVANVLLAHFVFVRGKHIL